MSRPLPIFLNPIHSNRNAANRSAGTSLRRIKSGHLVHSPLLELGSQRSPRFRIAHPFAWKNRETKNPPRKKLMVSALDAKHRTLPYIAGGKLGSGHRQGQLPALDESDVLLNRA
jgi:hypothetical protein